jgi:hypothetical protein
MTCEALATKAELKALEAKLSALTKGSNFDNAVKKAIVPLLGAYATKESFSTLKALADGNAQWIKVNGNVVSKLPQLEAKLTQTTNVAQGAANAAAVTTATVASMISAALAGLGIGTLIKQLIDQKANQIQFGRQQQEIEASSQAANDAFQQAIRARIEARAVQSQAERAIAEANRAAATANQAIALSNRESAANAFAQEAARKANAAAASAQARAKAIQQAANESIKNLQTQVKQTEEAYKQDITRVKVEQTVNRAEQLKTTQQEINRVRVEQTVQRAEQLKQTNSLTQRQTEVETNVRTTLKGVTTQVQQLAPLKTSAIQLQSTVDQGLKTTAKQLESSLNQTVTEQVKAANTQIVTQIQAQTSQQIKTEIQQVQQQNIKMNEEQFQKIDTKLTNVLATAGIAAATATVIPQILQKVSNITPAPCLAPVFVPPVDAKVSTNIGLTNTLQGVVVAQNAVLQGTANAINTTVQATNGIVRAMQPVLNTVSNGLNALTTFSKTAWKATRMDKVLNALNTLLLLHNAAMLSRNLAASLGDAISAIANNTLSFIKNEEDTSININETLGNTIEGFLTSLLGAENYQNISETFAKYNRIVNAAANIIWSIQSAMAGIAEGLEIMGEYTGKIGNALKKSGAVLENSYQWMSETFSVKTGRLGKLQQVLDGAEAVENVASEIQNATEEFREAQENVNQIGEQFNKVKDEVVTKEGEKTQVETTNKNNSQASQPTQADYVPDPVEE